MSQAALRAAIEEGLKGSLPASHNSRPEARSSLIRRALLLNDEDAYAAGEVGFFARALVQATLPHSDPGGNEFVRENGHYTLTILAPAHLGLPYGRYPRLVLAYLNTEAVRTKRRRISLGRTLSHFCRDLGIVPTSGPRGSLRQLRKQMERLFSCSFQCVYQAADRGQHAGDGFLLAERRALWWDPESSTQELVECSFVELSERFFREATGAPVPIDIRVLRALRSPFEIDIYIWLTWRFFRLRRPVVVPWASLMLQFGCAYRSQRHFKQRFLAYLANVIGYYPAARLETCRAGLRLNPSRPHVGPRSRSVTSAHR